MVSSKGPLPSTPLEGLPQRKEGFPQSQGTSLHKGDAEAWELSSARGRSGRCRGLAGFNTIRWRHTLATWSSAVLGDKDTEPERQARITCGCQLQWQQGCAAPTWLCREPVSVRGRKLKSRRPLDSFWACKGMGCVLQIQADGDESQVVCMPTGPEVA